MRSAVYVARNFNAYNPDPVLPYGTVVGSNPLDTNDGDASYVEVTSPEIVSFRLIWQSGHTPPLSGVPGMYLTFDVGWRSTTGGEGSFELWPHINRAYPGEEPAWSSWTAVYEWPSPTSYEVRNDLGWSDGKISWDGSYFYEAPTIDGLLDGTALFMIQTFGHTLRVTYLRARLYWPGQDGILAIDTHDHPFHVVGTRDPAMPYELVIDTGTERVVEIVAGEEHLATHELVVDETGSPGTDWVHCGLFRPL